MGTKDDFKKGVTFPRRSTRVKTYRAHVGHGLCPDSMYMEKHSKRLKTSSREKVMYLARSNKKVACNLPNIFFGSRLSINKNKIIMKSIYYLSFYFLYAF